MFMHTASPISAIIPNLTEKGFPLSDDFRGSGFYDCHDIPQCSLRYSGMIMTQETLSGSCDPYFCRIGRRCAGGTMHMNRFQRIILICPEIDPIRADLKNLRHDRIHLPAQTEESDVRLIPISPGSGRSHLH